MNEEGIYYKKIIKNASLEQAFALCPKQICAMLSAVRPGEHQLTELQLKAMAINSINIPIAVKNDTGVTVLFELIKQYPGQNTVETLSRFTTQNITSEEMLLAHLKNNPASLIKFLRWNKGDASNEHTDCVVSQLIRPQSEQLRYYQLVDVRKLTTQLGNSGRVLYHAPTGAGKTRTAMSVVARHMINNGPTKVLWLASTAELVDQAAKAFTGEWKARGDTEAMIYQWRGGGANFAPKHATDKNTMLVASVQLLSRRSNELEQLKNSVSLIVFDEAHQSLAPTYRKIINLLMETKSCSLLGLSATPSRAESDEASAHLSEMYGNNRVTIHCPQGNNPINFLVKEGYLSKHKLHVMPISINNTPKPKPDSDDYDNQLLEWLGLNIERNLKIVDLVKKCIESNHNRILVFAPSLGSALFCKLVLQEKHQIQGSFVVAGDTPREERANILQRYSSSDSDPAVIFNFGVLTTGFDAPQTRSVIIARPTKSLPLYNQMLGRALRGKKSGGTHSADIYTLADQSLKDYTNLAVIFNSFNLGWNEKQ